MKTPNMTCISIPTFKEICLNLPFAGKFMVSSNNLAYLDVDDEFIHQLFPLLGNKKIIKPNYFGVGSVGAHITVAYPEEGIRFDKGDLNREHNFQAKDVVAAEIGSKIYYVLLVESPSLLKLRRQYNLSDMLCFKGYSIGFHITVGVELVCY
jgi:hypothetical protein